MFFFQTNHLHFSAEFLGRVRLVGSIASLAGVGTYNYLLKDVALTKMFFWTAVLGTGLGLTQLILITGAAFHKIFLLAHQALLPLHQALLLLHHAWLLLHQALFHLHQALLLAH